MDKLLVAKTLKAVKETSPKRNFKQSIDLVINLKDIDLKKPGHQVNAFITLNHSNGRKVSVCALVGPEMETKVKDIVDEVITSDKFDRFKGKKEIKQLANKHDFFISQVEAMPKVATVFGRFLGPRGKMPNPKVGAVVPVNANVKASYEKLSKTVNLITKNEPTIKCMVGREDGNEDEVVDNVMMVYNSLLQKLPNEKHNIKNVMLKLTMGPSFAVKESEEAKEVRAKQKRSAQTSTVQSKNEPIEQKAPKNDAPKTDAKDTAQKNQGKKKKESKEENKQ